MVWIFLLAALALAVMTYFAVRQARQNLVLDEVLVEEEGTAPHEGGYVGASVPSLS